jgi:hypothetical protein
MPRQALVAPIDILSKEVILLSNSQTSHCDVALNLNKYSQSVDMHRWLCPRCKRFSSTIRQGSFLLKVISHYLSCCI